MEKFKGYSTDLKPKIIANPQPELNGIERQIREKYAIVKETYMPNKTRCHLNTQPKRLKKIIYELKSKERYIAYCKYLLKNYPECCDNNLKKQLAMDIFKTNLIKTYVYHLLLRKKRGDDFYESFRSC